MMLNNGIYRWERIFKSETVKLLQISLLMLSKVLGVSDGTALLGKHLGVYLSDNSYGHAGFTGTSLWIDPENGVL